jgi:hypothetical protein
MIAHLGAVLYELDHGCVGSRLPTAASTSTNPAGSKTLLRAGDCVLVHVSADNISRARGRRKLLHQ